MSITALSGNTLSGQSGTAASSSQATSAVSAGSQLLAKVDKRIQADVDATTARLSKYGLLKSAVSSSQLAAHGLTSLSSSATASELTSAVGKFFNTFNAAATAAKNVAAVPGATAASQSASRVSGDLKQALSSDLATRDAMKKLGLTVQADGSLVQDAKKFAAALASDPAAVRSALATVGKQVDTVTSKELAANGRVAVEMSSLNKHGVALAAQQKALKTLETSLATTQTTSTSSKTGLGAYLANSTGW
jgi:hypothetical protein